MSPSLPRGAVLGAVLGAVSFAPPSVQAFPQTSTDCSNAAGWEDLCRDLVPATCNQYYYGEGCFLVSRYDLCPRTCEACLYYDETSAWSCDPDDSDVGWTSDDSEFGAEDAGVAVVAIVYWIFCCGCAVVVPLVQLCCLCQAHQQRQVLLNNARQGPVQPTNDNCCYLCMCGCVAIYFWEGISVNWLITVFVWPWWAVCCWSKTPCPMDNGVQILPPGQAQFQAGMQVQYVQPGTQQPAQGFQPGMQQPPVVQAQVVQATPVQPGAMVVGAPVATEGESYADK